MIIESLTVGPVHTNVYVVGCPETKKGAIIDGGAEPEALLKTAEKHDLEIKKILQTHAHVDHVAGLNTLKQRTGAPIYLHKKELEIYRAAPMQAQMFGFQLDSLPEIDEFLSAGDSVRIGNYLGDVFLLPGHSPGSVGFYFPDQDVIFSGDVLFQASIGRTDLPGADPDKMKQSLQTMMQLPDETRVLSGHGAETTIGREKKANPFLQG